MSDGESNRPKRHKSNHDGALAIQPGSQVRLVNLPAHPGLEGVLATVVSIEEDNYLQVEIKNTKVLKQIKRDKVRPILVGCIVELHGLVSAYKLNGRIGECISFDDEELFRYNVVLRDGVNKKVKPENVRFVAKYDTDMITKHQIDSLVEELSLSTRSLRDRVDILTKANRIVPDAISFRVLQDYMKLDSEELRAKLLESKRVSVASLVGSDNIELIYVSLPRERLVSRGDDEEEKRIFRRILTADCEAYLKSQVYFIVPFLINRDVGLPMIDRAVDCSYPLFPFLADAMILALSEKEKMDSLRFSTQRMDFWLAQNIFKKEVFVSIKPSSSWKHMKEIEVRAGLPSRGQSCQDDDLIKEIEKSLEMMSPSSTGGWHNCMLIN